MSTADDLRAIRGLLATPAQWLKGKFSNRDRVVKTTPTAFCLVGALNEVTCARIASGGISCWEVRGLEESHPAEIVRRVIQQAIVEVTGVDHRFLFRFNDAPLTTHADVLAVLDRAIALAEAT